MLNDQDLALMQRLRGAERYGADPCRLAGGLI